MNQQSSITSQQKLPGPLVIDINTAPEQAERILKGISSEPRLRILRLLRRNALSINDISAALDIPATTVAMHINILEEADLVHTELQPASRGRQKICTATPFEQVLILFPVAENTLNKPLEVAMPLGAYVDCQVTPTCGLVDEHGYIGEADNPTAFYFPERFNAQLIWFRQGYLEYRFPNILPPQASLESIQFSMEICSEAPQHNPDWPSEITVWINDVAIGSWTSPADFGNERGVLTPIWWEDRSSQYGLLKVWKVTTTGSFVDGIQISGVTLKDLTILPGNYISMRVGVRDDATHVGGMNIFGRGFGNYPQDIVMRLHFRQGSQP